MTGLVSLERSTKIQHNPHRKKMQHAVSTMNKNLDIFSTGFHETLLQSLPSERIPERIVGSGRSARFAPALESSQTSQRDRCGVLARIWRFLFCIWPVAFWTISQADTLKSLGPCPRLLDRFGIANFSVPQGLYSFKMYNYANGPTTVVTVDLTTLGVVLLHS